MPYNELGFFFILNSDEISAEKIVELDNLYSAIRTSREIREGSEKLCKRFIKAWNKIEQLSLLNL